MYLKNYKKKTPTPLHYSSWDGGNLKLQFLYYHFQLFRSGFRANKIKWQRNRSVSNTSSRLEKNILKKKTKNSHVSKSSWFISCDVFIWPWNLSFSLLNWPWCLSLLQHSLLPPPFICHSSNRFLSPLSLFSQAS